MIPIATIRTDGKTQPRSALDQSLVSELAHSLRNGETLPPVDVFYDGESHWLADGFHRLQAHVNVGRREIAAVVHAGDAREAFILALARLGNKPLTLDEKRAAAARLIAEWPDYSDRRIARLTGLSHPTVSELRPKPLVPSGKSFQMPTKRSHMEKPNLQQADVIPIDRAKVEPTPAPVPAPVAAPPAEPRKVKVKRNGKEFEMRVTPRTGRGKGGVRRLGIKALEQLSKTALADDKAEKRRLAAYPRGVQKAIAQRIANGEASSVKEAADAIFAGAPIDAFGKAYEWAHKLDANDRRILIKLLARELDEKAA